MFKDFKKIIPKNTVIIGDSGYTGMQKYYSNCLIARRRKQGKKLIKEDKFFNKNLSKNVL